MTGIEWEEAPGRLDRDPRDMQADASVVGHGYWSYGPEAEGGYSLTLVEQDENLETIFEWQWAAATEDDVQRIAQETEDTGHPPARLSLDCRSSRLHSTIGVADPPWRRERGEQL
jgi:hypothetical protein